MREDGMTDGKIIAIYCRQMVDELTWAAAYWKRIAVQAWALRALAEMEIERGPALGRRRARLEIIAARSHSRYERRFQRYQRLMKVIYEQVPFPPENSQNHVQAAAGD